MKKLSAHPYAQASVTESRNGPILWSYQTKAAEIRRGWLIVYCLCSRTTINHVKSFVAEYAANVGLELEGIKMLHRSGYALNLETGEVQFREEII